MEQEEDTLSEPLRGGRGKKSMGRLGLLGRRGLARKKKKKSSEASRLGGCDVLERRYLSRVGTKK